MTTPNELATDDGYCPCCGTRLNKKSRNNLEFF